jgi:hypothetical protein
MTINLLHHWLPPALGMWIEEDQEYEDHPTRFRKIAYGEGGLPINLVWMLKRQRYNPLTEAIIPFFHRLGKSSM